jgi:general secretion pathway protein G
MAHNHNHKNHHAHHNKIKPRYGFTFVELLVIVAVIGLMSAIITVSINSSRQRAKVARAKADVSKITDASLLFAEDIGKWPNGCIATGTQNNTAGTQFLVQRPTAGWGSSGCLFDSVDASNWNGPYLKEGYDGINNMYRDPWGGYYQYVRASTIGDPSFPPTSFLIVSPGPDGSLANYADNVSKRLTF